MFFTQTEEKTREINLAFFHIVQKNAIFRFENFPFLIQSNTSRFKAYSILVCIARSRQGGGGFIQHSTVIIISMAAAKVTCSLWEHFDINNFKRGEDIPLCKKKGNFIQPGRGVNQMILFPWWYLKSLYKKNSTKLIVILI